MFLMLLTPVLGIFDTAHHFTKGKLIIDPNVNTTFFEPKNQQTYFQLWEEKYLEGSDLKFVYELN